MLIQEQQKLKTKYYGEAMRYMDNAKECLKNARKEDGYYFDQKYVRMACGTAYSGVLVSLDYFLKLKGIDKPKGKERKSIEYYQENLSIQDKKMLNQLNTVYEILHVSGYYEGIKKASVIKIGFDEAYKIIERIKPEAA